MQALRMNEHLPDPSYVANIAAIAGGFGLLGVLIVMLFTVTLLNKFAGKKQPTVRPVKQTSARDGGLYAGLLPQSTMGLVSSTSGQSFASSPSELFTMDKCVSGSVVEFHQHQHHQTRPASSSVTVIASGHPNSYENQALSVDEAKDSSNSDEGEDDYGPIRMIKVENQDSSTA